MKAIFTTVLFLLIAFSIAKGNNGYIQESMSYHIALMGHNNEHKIENPENTRSLPISPIQAYLYNAELCLEFSSPITELTVTLLRDDNVIVCHKFISIEAGQQEIIDLSRYESGDYQLTLTTPNGSHLIGHFIW